MFKNFQKSFMRAFWLNSFPPSRNFGEDIAVQDLRGIHAWNIFRNLPAPPPNQNPRAATDIHLTISIINLITYIIYINKNINLIQHFHLFKTLIPFHNCKVNHVKCLFYTSKITLWISGCHLSPPPNFYIWGTRLPMVVCMLFLIKHFDKDTVTGKFLQHSKSKHQQKYKL